MLAVRLRSDTEIELELSLRLQRKQQVAYRMPANEMLYGGAAGGGKSYFMRALAIAACVAIEGLQVYLFRRTHPDLIRNHIDGVDGFDAMLAPWYAAGIARHNQSAGTIRFHGTGSQINLCHCNHDSDRWMYQGAQIHLLLMDELTQFSEVVYRFLRSRVRAPGLKVPKAWRHRVPGIVAASNPGGLGHNFVKSAFIDPSPPMVPWRTPESEGGMWRAFVPALLEDNPALIEHDPAYEHRLEGLGDAELVKAMRHGAWTIRSGGMFDDIFARDVHVMQPFRIPDNWPVWRCHDWGDSKPFCTLILAESNGESVEVAGGKKRTFPRGTVFAVGEDYGWSGTPNTGLNLTSSEIATRVVDLEAALRRSGILGKQAIAPGPGDIPDRADGRSPRDEYAKRGVRFVAPDKGPGSRDAGWATVRDLLKATLAEPMSEPGLVLFDTCTHLIRTMPDAQRDERKREDIDTKAEDHALDALRYGVMRRGRSVSRLGLSYG